MRLDRILWAASNQATFRQVYKLPDAFSRRGWSQRHMYRGMMQMQAKLRSIDFVIELHDARIPMSGWNPDFLKYLYNIKPHVLVLNKADLVDSASFPAMEKSLRQTDQKLKNIYWSSCHKDPAGTAEQLKDLVVSEVRQLPRYHRTYTQDYHIMVVGIPNVGKSTLINVLRNQFLKKSAILSVGDRPGVTKTIHERVRLNQDPLIYVRDTPGVIPPTMADDETPMKMLHCNTIVVQMRNNNADPNCGLSFVLDEQA